MHDGNGVRADTMKNGDVVRRRLYERVDLGRLGDVRKRYVRVPERV